MPTYDFPVVLIHSGDAEYLSATFLQLRHSNPEACIILIGDKGNAHYKGYVDHYLVTDYFKKAEAFRKIYRHFSTNGFEFELICIQRWFVLNAFMKHWNMKQCVYLDSDVLVYHDLNQTQKSLNHYGMTVVGISAHTNFVCGQDVLDEFCEFVWDLYSNANAEQILRAKFESFLKEHPAGGISDMTLFTLFRKVNSKKVLDLSIIRNGTVFDITLDTVYEYQSKFGFKKIGWKNRTPHAQHLPTGLQVQFHTLHFQGKCKPKIYQFTTYGVRYSLVSLYFRLRFHLKRIVRKLS